MEIAIFRPPVRWSPEYKSSMRPRFETLDSNKRVLEMEKHPFRSAKFRRDLTSRSCEIAKRDTQQQTREQSGEPVAKRIAASQ